MPIYEFRCQKCAHQFEVMRRVSQMADPAACPACRSKRTERRISTFAIASGAAPDIMQSDIDPSDFGDEWMDDDGGGDWDDF